MTSCDYQGGVASTGIDDVSAGGSACREVAAGAKRETMEDVSDPRERRNSGGLAEQHLEEMFDMGSIPVPTPQPATPCRGV